MSVLVSEECPTQLRTDAGDITDGRRWVAPLEPADEDALARCRPPVLDVGCGPGNLTRTLGITIDDLGTDLRDPAPVTLRRPAAAADSERILSGPRVGVRRAAEQPWRFWLADEPSVSAYRRHPRAGDAD